MATDNQTDNTNQDPQTTKTDTDNQTDTQQVEPKYESLDDAIARIKQLEGIKKDLIGQRDEVKTKLRSYEEKEQTEAQKKLEEQGEFKQLLEAERQKMSELQQRLRQRDIDGAVNSALKEVGLAEEAFGTALKLVDVASIGYDDDKGVDSESVMKAIDKLKAEHAILFQTKPKTPDVKRTTGSVEGSDYHTELKALIDTGTCTRARIAELKKRFGK